jgi:molecular chaperone IbpA
MSSLSLRRNNNMASFDSFDKMFAPLFQRSVGFDRMFESMNNALQDLGEGSGYPPYDITQSGEDTYTIRMAIAGFSHDDINVELENGLLTVSGSKEVGEESTEEVKYLHRGIANRKFLHRFRLTDHIRVEGASLNNGMLTLSLVRELPEALKPRVIEVTAA